MAWTNEQIAALETALATGVKRVEFVSGDTRRVQEFQSTRDMQMLLDRMRMERAAAADAAISSAIASHSRD